MVTKCSFLYQLLNHDLLFLILNKTFIVNIVNVYVYYYTVSILQIVQVLLYSDIEDFISLNTRKATKAMRINNNKNKMITNSWLCSVSYFGSSKKEDFIFSSFEFLVYFLIYIQNCKMVFHVCIKLCVFFQNEVWLRQPSRFLLYPTKLIL